MKLVFKTKDLLDKIKNIAPTAEAKLTLPILGNIKISIASNVAEFVASDLEIQVTSAMACEADQDGTFTIPAKKLLEFVARFRLMMKYHCTMMARKLI